MENKKLFGFSGLINGPHYALNHLIFFGILIGASLPLVFISAWLDLDRSSQLSLMKGCIVCVSIPMVVCHAGLTIRRIRDLLPEKFHTLGYLTLFFFIIAIPFIGQIWMLCLFFMSGNMKAHKTGQPSPLQKLFRK